MKTKKHVQGVLAIFGLIWVGLCVVACESSGETPFGKACQTGADCISEFCVGGEAGTVPAPFCSDDCTGKSTGDACGEAQQGKCIADFVSWCWMPCAADAECAAINPERPICSVTSSSGVESPFKVCVGKAKM